MNATAEARRGLQRPESQWSQSERSERTRRWRGVLVETPICTTCLCIYIYMKRPPQVTRYSLKTHGAEGFWGTCGGLFNLYVCFIFMSECQSFGRMQIGGIISFRPGTNWPQSGIAHKQCDPCGNSFSWLKPKFHGHPWTMH